MINVEIIRNDLEKRVEELGFILYSLKFLKSKNGNTLEIIIDRDESIDLDDIVKVSNELSLLLDQLIQDDDPYVLDVSSLGCEKPIALEKLDKYQGKYVNLHLSHPFKGLNTLEGDLEKVTDDEVILVYKEKTRKIKATIKRQDIDKARLAIKF